MVVVIFHLLTRWLFPIGMFPFLMIGASLIFFAPDTHRQIWDRLYALLGWRSSVQQKPFRPNLLLPGGLALLLLLQLILPFRYLAYPGELFWTEQGYRFSWRVMLMEKTGYAEFTVVNPQTGDRLVVDNRQYLTPFQEKQMATQPDMILDYAHYLADRYAEMGIPDPEIYVESYVALNGRSSQLYIDPSVNLAKKKPSLRHKDWILPYPYAEPIRGL